MAEDDERAARGQRRRRPRQQGAPVVGPKVHVEDEHEVERVGRGLVLTDVRQHPVDVPPVPAREREGDLGEVDRGHLPAALGEPARGPAGAAAEVEGATRRQALELAGEDADRVVGAVEAVLLPAPVPVLAFHGLSNT